MPAKVLIAYASIHGSTAEVAQFLGRILRTYNAEVTVAKAGQVTAIDGFDAFLLGTAIEDGMWLHEMFSFLDRFQAQIAKKPNYFWLNCIRVLESDGYEHALKYYVHQPTLDALAVRDVAVFAGKLKLEATNWDERWLLSLRYDGAERPAFLNKDFRNWEVIAAWGNKIAHELNLTPMFEDDKIAAK